MTTLLPLLFGIGLCALVLTKKGHKLHRVPHIGHSGTWSSYLTAFKFVFNSDGLIIEGCRKFHGKIFRVPQLDQWLLVTSGQNHLATLRDSTEDTLSFKAAVTDIIQPDYTLGNEIQRGTSYNTAIGRFIAPRNLTEIITDLIDELVTSVESEVTNRLKEDGWTPLPAIDIFQRVICQSINRTFVGLPLCRNKDFQDVALQFTTNVIVGASFINLFPNFLKPLAGKVYTKVSGHTRRIVKHVGPHVEERLRLIAQYGSDYPGKPNDLLAYFIDAAVNEEERTAEAIGLRLLNINFAALHTTSMTFIHALYQLASMPDCMNTLRVEVKDKLGKDPSLWTRDVLEDCWKLDSFFKESQRVNYLSSVSMARKATRDVTLSDGTTVPAGVTIVGSIWDAHMDKEVYPDAETFKPFRFSDIREKITSEKGSNTEEDNRHRMTGTGLHFLAFGTGKHICSGRFIASQEIKALMALLLLRYEFTTEREGVRPADFWFGIARIPNSRAKILFRRM